MWPYLAGSILAAFMASAEIYKIWYIATAIVLFMSVFCVRVSWREIGHFLLDAKWFAFYWIAILLSVRYSIDPETSQLQLLYDSIFPFVFLIFYYVGLRTDFETVCMVMRLQVWTAIIILATGLDVEVAERVGYRMMFVLPYVVPFIVAAIYAGRRLAFVELPAVMLILLVSNSRTQIATALVVFVISAIAFRTSMTRLMWQTGGIVAVVAVTVLVAYQFDASRQLILFTVVRLTGVPILDAATNTLIDVEFDTIRDNINALFSVMFWDGGWTGIGLEAFGPIWIAYWNLKGTYDEMSLHSIYQVWWLELGYLGTAAALAMLGSFFIRATAARKNPLVAASTIGFLGTLMAGNFHQMHQAPMFYAMLGMGLGAARVAKTNRSG
jgi:O-antigen ligase